MRFMRILFTIAFVVTLNCVFAQPFRTPVFTGNAMNDFKTEEKTIPVGTGATYAVTWDNNFIYFGVSGPGAYIKNEPTIIYLDTDPSALQNTGSTSGFNYDNRQPTLPFAANFVLYMKSGYAEIRTAAVLSGPWSNAVTVTDSLITGATDIEIRIPWTLFAGGQRPASFSSLYFKTNGNPANADVYDLRPGITNVGETYGLNINLRPPQLFYRLNSTNNGFNNGLNLFDWIFFGAGCVPPSALLATSITATSAKLNWQPVLTKDYYLIRGRKKGTVNWLSSIVPANRNSVVVNNLVCNTNYEWHIRTTCDTTQAADINSGFSELSSFKTSACAAFQDPKNENLKISPNPSRAGSGISLSGLKSVNSSYKIYRLDGSVVQSGKVNLNTVLLGNSIKPGLYLLETDTNGLKQKAMLQLVE